MENSKLEEMVEVIGGLIFDELYEDHQETHDEIAKFIDLAVNSHVLVEYKDSRKHLNEEWFKKEAIAALQVDEGPLSYFIPLKRIIG